VSKSQNTFLWLILYKTGGSSAENRHIFLRSIWDNPLSDGCINVARGWLERCTKDHARCGQPEGFLSPTRLLNISKPPPFICTPNIKNTRYAALSYCWGEKETITTTKANLKSHEEGIEFSILPKTFQDAILIAQKLDINFLWVDSLCIIQDDEDDWDAQCLRMGEYYQNSFVTISALDASGSAEGFLYLRPQTPAIRLFEYSTTYIRPATTFNRRKIFENAALSKRGWTLQERLLSTRILHYSKLEMFWECRTCSAREGSTKEHVDRVDSRSLGNSEGDDFKRVLQHMDSNQYSPSHGAFAVWYRLVKQYTRRSLSRPSDRLPAISGLAGLFTTATGCRYIAGLWAEDAHGLLWLKDRCGGNYYGIETYHSYPWEWENYRAPSWSWAAVDGPVAFALYDEERTFSANDATIVNHSIEPQGSSKLGAVLPGSLTLRALSKNVQCLPQKNLGAKPESYYIDGFVAEHCKLDYKYYQVGVPHSRYTLRIFDEVGKEFGLGICDDEAMEGLVTECVAVWIGEYIYDGRTPTRAVYFLLIAPVENEPGTWRRVGLGVTKDDPDLQGFFTTVFDCYEWSDFVLV
jgi:hypothetical protein